MCDVCVWHSGRGWVWGRWVALALAPVEFQSGTSFASSRSCLSALLRWPQGQSLLCVQRVLPDFSAKDSRSQISPFSWDVGRLGLADLKGVYHHV